MAKEYTGQVRFYGINVDRGQKTAGKFGVMAIPALVFFRQGKETGRIVGAAPKQKILTELKKILASGG